MMSVENTVDYELNKADTKMMQGLSVLAMVTLHLFDTLDYEGKFTPLIHLGGYPLIFYFSQLSDFCVMAFAFCSGYAHMTQYGKPGYYRRRLIGLLGVYINFWIILMLFSIVSAMIGNGSQMPGSLQSFIGNFTTLHLSYNGAWWYILTYALITFSSPVLLRLSKRFGKGKTIAVSGLMIVVYCIGYYERFRLHSSNWFIHQAGLYGTTMAEYMMGAIACDRKVFTRLMNLWNRIFRNKLADRTVTALLLILLLWGRTKVVPSFFAAPISGFILLFLFQKAYKPDWFRKCFLTLGNNSTNIWLTHMFFYLYVFTGLVFAAKYPILILMFMLAITMAVSLIINAIHKPLFMIVKNHLKA